MTNIEMKEVNIIRQFNDIDEDLAPVLREKLEKVYMENNLTNKLNLKQQLYRLKMEEGVNLLDHLNVFD